MWYYINRLGTPNQYILGGHQMAAQKKIVDQVREMNEEELAEIIEAVDERKQEIKLEKSKELMKKIFVGQYVLYSKGYKENQVGIVDILTSEYIGVKNVDSESKKNRRIDYLDIIEISDNMNDEWIS